MSETGPSIKSRAARVAGTIAVAGALGLGLDQGRAHADDPTKSPTSAPVASSTPDRLATQIVDARATVTALGEQRKKEKELVDLRATATVIQEEINAVRGTPTRTPTPSPTRIPDATTVAESTRIANLAKFQAEIKTTATAEAEATARAKATATPSSSTPTPAPEPGRPAAPAGPAGGQGDGHDPDAPSLKDFRDKTLGVVGQALPWAVAGTVALGAIAGVARALPVVRRRFVGRGPAPPAPRSRPPEGLVRPRAEEIARIDQRR